MKKRSAPKAAIILPARLASTRLPGKLLLAETGRPLLAHTVERALEAQAASGGRIARVLVAADCPALAEAARAAGAEAVLTDPNHPSGTDRIAEAACGLREGVIINLQADEPEMPAASILRLLALLDAPGEVMATLAAPIGAPEDLANPSVVKVVLDATGHALYFSRAPIPFAREGWAGRDPRKAVLRHFGIYAYRREFLLAYSKLPASRLEEIEKLEQLRTLEAGRRIACAVVESLPEGIDTPESYATFVARWRKSHQGTKPT
jgi:3-deoxy-manno-octulosonate cytidylyltransferase (CMP-KDO synthetase)